MGPAVEVMFYFFEGSPVQASPVWISLTPDYFGRDKPASQPGASPVLIVFGAEPRISATNTDLDGNIDEDAVYFFVS